MSGRDARATQRSAPMMWRNGSLILEGGVVSMTSRLQPSGSGEERGSQSVRPNLLSNLVRLEQIKGASIGIIVNGDAKDSCDMAKIFQLEVLIKSLLEKLNIVEMSNENQVINVDREDDSVISCVEAKHTVHLIIIGLIALA